MPIVQQAGRSGCSPSRRRRASTSSALQVLDLKPAGDAAARCEMLLGLGEAQARAGGRGRSERRRSSRAAEIARSAGSRGAARPRRARLRRELFVWMVQRDRRGTRCLSSTMHSRELGERRERAASQGSRTPRLARSATNREPERRDRAHRAGGRASPAASKDHSALAYALDGQVLRRSGRPRQPRGAPPTSSDELARPSRARSATGNE